MRDILSAETAAGRKVWFAVGSGEGEPRQAPARAPLRVPRSRLEGRDADDHRAWCAPGVAMLSRPTRPPPLWVGSVQRALDASGLAVKYFTGYRSYYEKKSKDPKWVGVPIAADQTFVIVIGPEPKP